MEYCTSDQMAKKWGISKQMVRRYCKDGRVDTAVYENGVWLIDKNQKRPERKSYTKKADFPITPQHEPELLESLRAQRKKRKFSGLYEDIQINMAYSNNRLASGRLTRNQITALFQTDNFFTVNEHIKVNDIIEARNSFLCVDLIMDEAMKPLTQRFILKLHKTICANIIGPKRLPLQSGKFRSTPSAKNQTAAASSLQMAKVINELFSNYEQQNNIGLEQILDLHVQFEKVHPFDDFNGRIGRLIIFKECLRHEITPFIIHDKVRRTYLDGINSWEVQKDCLLDLCINLQEQFQSSIEVNQHLEELDRAKRRRERRRRAKLAQQEKIKKPS